MYDLSDFSGLQSAKVQVGLSLALAELPSIEEVKTLAKWTPEMVDRFNRDAAWFEDKTAEPHRDRSGAMGAFSYLAAENGWSDEQLMAALIDIDDRWGKYVGRRDREKRLVDFVNRARVKVGYNPIDMDLSMLFDGSDPVLQEDGESKLVYGFQDFIDMEFNIDWMLEGLLAVGGFGLLVAHPGVGKTTLAIQMAAYLALGKDRFLKWDNVGGSKKVLFLSLEMGKAPFHLFLSNIAENYEDRNTLNRNFLVAPLGSPMPLDTPEGQAFLNNLMDEYMPDLVVIDSLQKISSKELTDEQAVKNLVHYLSGLRTKYKTTLLVVHHNRKKPNDAQKKSVELSDVYGSTYITTDVDFVLNLHKVAQDLVMVTTLKSRLGPEEEPFEIARGQHLTFTMDFEGLMDDYKKAGVELDV